MNILGISRSPRFSPNSADRDNAIFSAVASRLMHVGPEVSVIAEDVFVAVDLEEFDAVFSMARGADVVHQLCETAAAGKPVLNAPDALLKASRAALTACFQEHDIPQPRSLCLATDSPDVPSAISFPLWLKRGDACAQSAADVCFIEDAETLRRTLADFHARGIAAAVASQHAEGDLVKFYGVEGTDFFHFLYPTEGEGFSKFGLEARNGVPHHFPFDAAQLKCIADRAASVSGLTVYGGDAIVRADGSILIIDFNDWPSFSPCRRPAAKAIAQRLVKSL